MPRKISLIVVAVAFGASLALGPSAVAAGMGSGGTGGASGGAQNGFGGPSGGTGHGGFASPGGAGSGGHSGHGGPSLSTHDMTHSHGGARGNSHRDGGTAAGFGATAPGSPTVSSGVSSGISSGAKSVIVAPSATAHRSSRTSHFHGGSAAGDFHLRRHRDHFHHHAIPFLFFTGIGTVPVVTETEPAIEPGIESQSFTVTNDTDSEMTVLDSGLQICVLAPRARCSFETTSGHHDISVTISGRQSSDLEDRPHGGHMIDVGREAE